MKFSDFFINEKKDDKTNKETDRKSEVKKEPKESKKKKLDPSEMLRDAEIKIKLVVPTNFGTEYILARKYPQKEISDALKDLKFEIKNNSVFVFH